ncbi:helix-turn-helix transcriptional regulator [Bacillus sp. CMF12]|uniref:helix-turn-helix transcriptional regulator n=1 Tax=Bacillus sp. CMF12 TaxID=2884834 RepID=UPI00207A577C|nr:helix-turn-helix transcriptional regulator [Bacillus sp. CMF12]USK48894.1 helix-turn-helix transcriptional regulator [Bacillus sp. CMF12]
MMKIKVKNTEEFKKLLLIKGFSQRTFSKSVKISNPHFNLIINGERNPSGKVAKKIADGLNVRFEDIFFVDYACK